MGKNNPSLAPEATRPFVPGIFESWLVILHPAGLEEEKKTIYFQACYSAAFHETNLTLILRARAEGKVFFE